MTRFIKERRNLICLILVLILVNRAESQIDFNNLHFITKEGITSRQAISSIVQESSGMTWIGTFGGGLYRFDGINYVSYTHKWRDTSSLNSNLIYCLLLDRSGEVWAGTDTGLSRYDKKLDKFEPIQLTADFNLGGQYNIRELVQADDDVFYAVTYRFGLIRIDPEKLTVERMPVKIDTPSGFVINDIDLSSKGRVYIGTSIGVLELVDGGLIAGEEFNLTRGKNVQTLKTDTSDNLWVGTLETGLVKLEYAPDGLVKGVNLPVTKKKVLSLLTIEGVVLVGTENEGLVVLNQDGSLLKHYWYNQSDEKSIGSNSIWTLYEDAQGRIWMGSYNAGVEVHDDSFNKFESLETIPYDKNSLQTNMVTGIDKDASGRLWISLESGVDVLDTRRGVIDHVKMGQKNEEGTFENSISGETIFIDSKGNVWLGTWDNGLYFLENGKSEFVNYTRENTNGELVTNSLLSFAEDKKGRVWMASFLKGLQYYDPEKKEFMHCDSSPFLLNSLTTADVGYVMADSKGSIWAGTSFGLFKVSYDADDNFSVKHITSTLNASANGHPSTNRITCVFESEDGTLWLGSKGAGLMVYDDNLKQYSVFSDHPSLNNGTVSSIIEDKMGILWLGGESGVFSVDPKTKAVRQFTTADGLLSDYFNIGAIEMGEDGEIYFGSYKGINSIIPEKIKVNENRPSLYFTGLKLFNKPVSPTSDDSPLDAVISETKEIELRHHQSVFTLEYMGISHTRPEKNVYAYQMEGFDQEWNYVGNIRSATYTNLKPGDYTFKVKVANNDGVWSDQILELKITVFPPWWKHQLAYLSYFIVLLVAVFGIASFSRRRFRETQALLLEKERRQQEEDLHQAKLVFFTNISHEFRTPLTLIMNPVRDIIKGYQNQLPQAVAGKLNTIRKNSDRLSRLINELMDFRKLETNKIELKVGELEFVQKTHDVLSYFYEEAQRRHISLDFVSEVKSLVGWVDQGMFEKILFNILSNAFKVTPESGTITVTARETKKELLNPVTSEKELIDHFVLAIRDTGPGIDQKDYKQIFNRFYQVGQRNKSYYGSSGVGLAMVKGFVELHHGTIEINSELSKWTEFTISLPVNRSVFRDDQLLREEPGSHFTVNEEESTSEQPPVTEETNHKQDTQTVLVVEDNQELLLYVKQELMKEYKVIVATNGKEGLELAIEKSPDLIITDVVMPLMDGFEFCRNIKEKIQTSHIPLLMLTAKGTVEDRVRGLDMGADAYLSKPFDMRELKATMGQLAKNRQLLFAKYFSAISNTEENVSSLDKQFIQKVLSYINDNMADPNLSVDVLASELNLSRSQFYRKIKSLTNKTAVEFVRSVRLQKARKLIEDGHKKINDVCYEVGFSSPSYFSKCFKNEFGVSPTQLASSQRDSLLN